VRTFPPDLNTGTNIDPIKIIFPCYFYLIRAATAEEESLRLVSAVLKHSHERAFTKSNCFYDGQQADHRYRMAFELKLFTERDLILKLLDDKMNLIKKNDEKFDHNQFKPNVIICHLTHNQGFLKNHWDDEVGSPYVAIWSFGSTIQYVIRPPKEEGKRKGKEKEDDCEVHASEFKFLLNSGDFVFFNGRKVNHGYNHFNIENFKNSFDPKFQFKDEIFGIKREFRISIMLSEYDDVTKLSKYYYGGHNHNTPKIMDYRIL